jgi:drug/metabolite transporter (DMT)-like permease
MLHNLKKIARFNLFYDLCDSFMNNKVISWSIFILLCFIWGSSFAVMAVASEGLTAVQIAALRIFAAGLVFVPFAVFHISKLPGNKLLLVISLGLFGNLLPAFLFAFAVSNMNNSSLVGILNSLTPICVVTIGIAVFRDKIQAQKIAGVLVGFIGLCLLTFTQKDVSLSNLGYASLAVLGAISYGLNVNIYSHYFKGSNPVHISSVALAFMAIPAGIVLWWSGYFQLDFSDNIIQLSSVATILLGIVASSISTVLFYMLVQKAGGLFASLVTYGIPFVALFWGILRKEPVTWLEVLCLCIILSGVYLANRNKK